MKFDKSYISTRFIVLFIIVLIFGGVVIYNMVLRMFGERERWITLSEKLVTDTVPLPQTRGNILSAEGQLMASSLPSYKLYMDFKSGGADVDTAAMRKKKEMFNENMDSICMGLAEICPIKTAEEYEAHIRRGLARGSRWYELCPGQTLNYIQYNRIKELPLFRLGPNTSGLVAQERNGRKKPFGSLARRTLGELYAAKDSARSGIELAYDSLLRGKPGMKHRKKVLNKYLDIIDIPAQDGYDVVSTIDVNMQDICENALREKMSELTADVGVVVLMEVKTGDVKAIVNLQRYDDGNFYEARNYALASLMEPGSTFKTASMMVAMDDGYVHPSDMVDTGNGVEIMYGAKMKDHNWNKGGYHVLDVPHVLMVSSNIGVAKLIDKYYHHQPEKFVDGLKRVGIGMSLNLPFVGTADPHIRYPMKDRSNWPHTTIPWMSIGYETQIPPISTVTFYNAIANDGKMVKPRFVKGYSKNGEMIQEFPTEVIKEHICKEQTLHDIRAILQRVVCDKDGLGKPAGNPIFHVSGKTGTAQISAAGKYGTEHLVSFCGYFPSEDPKFTCIVAIRHNFWLASGGGQAGVVFSKIAQRVFSKHETRDLICATDSSTQFVPNVKSGSSEAARYVLNVLGIKAYEDEIGEWCTADVKGGSVMLSSRPMYDNTMPNVRGMGARDAIYALESRGLVARIRGRGKVVRQSVPAGTLVNKGKTIQLILN
ncbi:MAG: transpeptidase family protein [Bacteroidaceae bacterium]|nr:transpeptidase family protein [Bacteroidaceae bacterium]